MASLVFIGHEASLTGAPYTQLYLLQWLRTHTPHAVELILLRGGPLLPEFEKVATVHVVHKYGAYPSLGQRILRKAEALTNLRLRSIFDKIAKTKPSLIFANTAPALEFAVKAKHLLKVPLLLNVHELESTFFYTDAKKFAANSPEIDSFIPGSQAVKEFYKTFCNIPENRTHIVYDFTGNTSVGISTAASIRQQYNIPANAKIIGGIGAFNWRKAPDLFLQVAQHCKRQGDGDAFFIWVGGDLTTQVFKEFAYDIRLMGLSEQVRFVGTKTDLRGFYEAFDVFLLTSREDPFPLVCMEAALSGSPVICFAEAGGMPEFVRQDAGFVVPYADTQAMSEKTSYLLAHADVRQAMGRVAQQRAESEHTIDVIGPQMYALMQPFLSR
ncbi:glycosyltransferase [Hymenobacter sp. HMF4947]|uniref:Glycosyltransferase n=1 Tax=Hymenobacter ginkgonis TaxID=2682976 RepID=A0A7K1TLJ7_9BACT|nr:glycosyltransferase family 4 protein [Hymenobacter ginkgonis]MVN78991.1 glycosyltransferase [Hymenobacter ginkgonis]